MNLFKAGDRVSVAALILVNLLPLAGVFFFDWDAFAVVLLYWAENLIIGGYTILKMALAPAEQPSHHLAKLFLVPFFCIHYGGFCAGHGFFILMFFSGFENGNDIAPFSGGPEWPGPLVFLQMLVGVVSHLWRTQPPEMIWPLLGLTVSHGLSFVQNFLIRKEYANSSVKDLMGAPYKRIVLLHIAIIAAGVPVMLLGSPIPLLAILIAMKIGMDLWLHNREHRKKSEV
jgi:hypothetical protein